MTTPSGTARVAAKNLDQLPPEDRQPILRTLDNLLDGLQQRDAVANAATGPVLRLRTVAGWKETRDRPPCR